MLVQVRSEILHRPIPLTEKPRDLVNEEGAACNLTQEVDSPPPTALTRGNELEKIREADVPEQNKTNSAPNQVISEQEAEQLLNNLISLYVTAISTPDNKSIVNSYSTQEDCKKWSEVRKLLSLHPNRAIPQKYEKNEKMTSIYNTTEALVQTSHY